MEGRTSTDTHYPKTSASTPSTGISTRVGNKWARTRAVAHARLVAGVAQAAAGVSWMRRRTALSPRGLERICRADLPGVWCIRARPAPQTQVLREGALHER